MSFTGKYKTIRSLLSATLVCFLLFFSLQANEDDIQFEKLDKGHGLSQSTVTCILQDHLGYLWIGTLDGLNRYDGYGFRIYRNDPLDPTSISDNEILAILEDSSGSIWVSTYGGWINRFDREKSKFHRSKISGNESAQETLVLSILEDRFQTIWIGTGKKGLFKVEKQTPPSSSPEFSSPFINDKEKPESLSSNHIRILYEDRKGNLWIGTNKGLNLFNKERTTFRRFQHDPQNPYSLSGDFVYCIYEDQFDELWIGTGTGLNKLNVKDPWTEPVTFKHYFHVGADPSSLSDFAVFSISEDILGNLWIGTYGGGLNRFDREEETFSHYVFDPENLHSLSNDVITKLYADRSGLIWVGTLAGGLNKILSAPRKFRLFRSDPGLSAHQNHNFIFSLYEDQNGTLWAGTRQGVGRLSRKESDSIIPLDIDILPVALKKELIRAILVDESGFLWIGTYGYGLFRVDPKSWGYERYSQVSAGIKRISSDYINTLFLGSKGKIWVGTSDGGLNSIEFLDASNSQPKITEYQHDPSNPSTIGDNNIRCVYEDRRGNIWVGTHSGGLSQLIFNQEINGKRTWIRYSHNPGDKASLSNNYVLTIHESRSGILWVGTSGGGLNRYDEDSKAFSFYTEQNGLANDTVYGILEDESENLWLSTNNGLSKFDPDTEFFYNFSLKDGLQDLEFNEGAYFQSKDGEMFFGGIAGINSFFPETETDNNTVPPIVITDLWIKKNDTQTQVEMTSNSDVSKKSFLTLKSKNSHISIDFSAMDFHQPEKNLYTYKIEGRDRDWTFLGNQHSLIISDLKSGDYVLRIKGSNNDGLWNEEGTALDIKVRSPIWLRGWLLFILFLILIATVTFTYLKRTKSVKTGEKIFRESKILGEYQLTKREAEILKLVIQGKSNRDIAETLFISEGTVKNHVYSTYQKLGVKNRLQILHMIRNS